MANKRYNIAIVGATGAVGQEFLQLIAERNFPINNILPLASNRSLGKNINFNSKIIKVEELTENSFNNVDIAFFSAGASISLKYAPSAMQAGALVIDNSSAFRNYSEYPLIIPEVNINVLTKNDRLISNPNCATIQLLVALNPLHKISPIEQIQVATYQAVSGTGSGAIAELERQTKQFAAGEKLTHEVYQTNIFGNLIPHIDTFLDNHYTKEEMKMVFETQKILQSPNIKVSATCVRVPVFRSHSEAVWVSFKDKITLSQAIAAWEKEDSIKVINQQSANGYPMPIHVSGTWHTYVGRLREDLTNDKGLCFWCVADQLLKGAALNAIQIAEHYTLKFN